MELDFLRNSDNSTVKEGFKDNTEVSAKIDNINHFHNPKHETAHIKR